MFFHLLPDHVLAPLFLQSSPNRHVISFNESMNRLLLPIRRSSLALRSKPLQGLTSTVPFPMAQLSTNAMAQASAVVGNTDKTPTSWHGAGAAEFDLRSMGSIRTGSAIGTNLI
jgi:hypothetical protein